jgi:hypothetical protein
VSHVQQLGQPSRDRLGRALLFAPAIFVTHFLEESPGFVSWFNAQVTRGITTDLFWTVNLTALLITLFVSLGYWTTKSQVGLLLAAGWLSFLMLTNAVFHVTGAVIDRGYVPGLVTAIVLYLPYCGWMARETVRGGRVPTTPLFAAVVLGGLPMALHGYRILFLGSRLF